MSWASTESQQSSSPREITTTTNFSLTCTKDTNVKSVLYLTGQVGSQIQIFSEAVSDASVFISVFNFCSAVQQKS